MEWALSCGGERLVAVIDKFIMGGLILAEMDAIVNVEADEFETFFGGIAREDAWVGFVWDPAVGQKMAAERGVPEAGGLFGAVETFFEFAYQRFAIGSSLFVAVGLFNPEVFINICAGESV